MVLRKSGIHHVLYAINAHYLWVCRPEFMGASWVCPHKLPMG